MSLFRKHPDYFKLWAAISISSFGDVLLTIWSVTFVSQKSDSSLLVALVFISAILPNILFALMAGSIADYFDSRKVLSVSALLQALILLPLIFGILYLDKGLVTLIVAINFLQSLANTLFNSSIQVLLPQSVPPELIQKANGRMSMSAEICGLLGFAVGGWLLATINHALIVAIDIATFVVVILAASLLQLVPTSDKDESPSLSFMINGLRHIAGSSRLRFLLIWAFLMGITVSPIAISLPAIANKISPDDPMLLSWHYIAMSGGSLLASVGISFWTVKRYREVLLFMGSLLGLSVFLLSWSHHVIVTLTATGVFGATSLFCMILIFSLLQKNTPRPLMGRVCAGFNIAVQAIVPPLYLLIGILSDHIRIEILMRASLSGVIIASIILILKGGALAQVDIPDEDTGNNETTLDLDQALKD